MSSESSDSPGLLSQLRTLRRGKGQFGKYSELDLGILFCDIQYIYLRIFLRSNSVNKESFDRNPNTVVTKDCQGLQHPLGNMCK
ncbi:hypothetical protein STEG23_023447, partial [Scotinomys teguina]